MQRTAHTHTHTHTSSLAELSQTAGFLSSPAQAILMSVAWCPKGTSLSLCLQGLTGPPSPEGRCSVPPNAAITSSLLHYWWAPLPCGVLLTTDGFYCNSLQWEEVVEFRIYSSGRMYGCVGQYKRVWVRIHECVLAPASCPVSLFSKAVCGVKSYCGLWMENVDMQPAGSLVRTFEDFQKTSVPYQQGRRKSSGGISKETELCT